MLPANRQMLTGRTFSTSWDPAGFDPIDTYQPPPTWLARVMNALCWAFALALIAAMFTAPHFWSYFQ